MARRIRSRKRKHLGNRTFGAGNTKNRRGKGNRGGKGRAGYHKHKWLHTIKFEGTNKRARGAHGFYNPAHKCHAALSLGQLSKKLSSFPKDDAGVYQIVLPGAKVLSGGSLQVKAHVKARGFSEKARQKIEEAGGTASTL